MKRCMVRDCDFPEFAWGWCATHYRRWRDWGHPLLNAREPFDRFVQQIDVLPNGCWHWRKPSKKGYGYFWSDGRPVLAHIWSYRYFIGPIPEGLVLDHMCHTTECSVPGFLCPHRACVNPTHLEPSTMAANVMRGNSFAAQNGRATHCKNGHEFTPENTIVRGKRRGCLACKQAAERIRMAARWQRLKDEAEFKAAKAATDRKHYVRNRAEIRAKQNEARRVKAEAEGRTLKVPMKDRTHCPKGHPYKGDNLLVDKDGHRRCRICTYGKNSRAGLKRLERLREEREAEGLPIGKGSANAVKTHCPYGHEYTPENTIVQQPSGARACRECSRIRAREYRAKKAGGHADAA